MWKNLTNLISYSIFTVGPQTVLIFTRHLSIIRSISQVRFNKIQLRKENFSCLIFVNDQ